MTLFPEATDRHQIQTILTSPYFQKALDKMERRCKRYRESPIEALPFHLYRKFYIDGDRRSFEDLYFARRGRLSYLALAILLYRRPEDIQALEDAIWAICEEFTWVLPAHTLALLTVSLPLPIVNTTFEPLTAVAEIAAPNEILSPLA